MIKKEDQFDVVLITLPEPVGPWSDEQNDYLSKLAFSTMIISTAYMLSLTVVLCLTMYRVCQSETSFRFLVRMIVLLLITDTTTVLLTIGLWLETTGYHAMYAYQLAWVIGLTTFTFNWGQNLMNWFFAFKYWIIAYEVPRLFNDGHVKF